MSLSMFLGRFVFPCAGLVLATALTWQSVQSLIARSTTGPSADAVAMDRTVFDTSAPAGQITAEGRVVAYPGAEVTVGTEVLGTIVAMPAREKAAVFKGDLLVELRAVDVRASIREARHRLTEAEVALRVEQARSGLDRMFPIKELTTAAARRDALAAALARRDAADAAVERLEAEAAKYRIVAPIDGVIVSCNVNLGETVSPASPLVTIVDMTRLRVEAEVDEYDIPGLVPKAAVTITAEGYRGRLWRGEVEEIADRVAPRRTRPEDPGRPADTHVLRVKVAFRESNPLRLGQRVEVQIARADRPR
jgi:RND family efflux transporter MFP subunit